ncbi:hypothetical protein KSP40_PGU012933 [Platanthera guangdongensis]|uniref:Late embryogenesis abundant protein n=1 Tax=Platanthera guangdongensis TaxID=2320717 RepID=A0ABR2LP06_9ASPA
MSASQFNAGRAHGEGQEKADQMMNTACDKAGDVSQASRETAEQAGGFMQQAGEKVSGMARDATESVKNTIGLGNEKTTTTTTARQTRAAKK